MTFDSLKEFILEGVEEPGLVSDDILSRASFHAIRDAQEDTNCSVADFDITPTLPVISNDLVSTLGTNTLTWAAAPFEVSGYMVLRSTNSGRPVAAKPIDGTSTYATGQSITYGTSTSYVAHYGLNQTLTVNQTGLSSAVVYHYTIYTIDNFNGEYIFKKYLNLDPTVTTIKKIVLSELPYRLDPDDYGYMNSLTEAYVHATYIDNVYMVSSTGDLTTVYNANRDDMEQGSLDSAVASAAFDKSGISWFSQTDLNGVHLRFRLRYVVDYTRGAFSASHTSTANVNGDLYLSMIPESIRRHLVCGIQSYLFKSLWTMTARKDFQTKYLMYREEWLTKTLPFMRQKMSETVTMDTMYGSIPPIILDYSL